jgi:putative membrane protein
MALLAFHLPTLNAALNATAALLLLCGFIAIRRRRKELHRRCMLAALATSALFLVSYVVHKAIVAIHTPFPGAGHARTVYFVILISHTLLAITVVPLALRVVHHARRERWEQHRRLARITFPIWLYVSITGVVIWWMLYSGTFGPIPGPAPTAGGG